jgi:ubiquinone/menaquinone biosynthesis C-methylase UbiE
MTIHSAQFAGSIPAFYDAGLGPQIFADYAADLAQRAAATKPANVLEIAAGTGIVTRLLRSALPESTHLIASDLNAPMLEIARQKFATDEQVEFQPADAIDLPFEQGAFDALVCQFGVMFFSDKNQAYREAHGVLVSGGRYYFNVWDSFEFNPFARITHEIVGSYFKQDAPSFYTVPFGYHRIDAVRTSLAAAGFEDISAQVFKLEKAIPNPRRFAEGLIRGTPIIKEIYDRGTADPEPIVTTLTAALKATFGNDPARMPLQAIVFSALKR